MYADVLERAESILSAHYHQPLSFGTLTPLQIEGRFVVLRCTVISADADVPRSGIIKHPNPDLPRDKQIAIIQTSRNEQAVLQVLTNVSDSYRYGPRYYTGDHLTGLLIMEDLGEYHTLQDVLYQQDVHQAREALVQYGRYLARMQLALRNQMRPYTAHLKRFGSTPQRDVFGWDVRDHLSAIHDCFDALQIEITSACDGAIHDLAHAIHDPGLFSTLSHCDAGPHNILMMPQQPILIDFESACFQHGFVDLVQARMAFPSAGLGRRSTLDVIEQMELAYRDELVTSIPQAADDHVFERGLVEACAHVVLTMLAEAWQARPYWWFATATSSPGSDKHKQRLITVLQAFLHAAESFQQLPEIRTLLQKAYDRISNRWPQIHVLPYFPVFEPDHIIETKSSA